MCEIIERQRAEAFAEGEAIGEASGERKAIIKLVKKNLLSIEDAVRETGMTEAAFRQELAML